MDNKRKLLIALSKRIARTPMKDALEQMWNDKLLDVKALERLYIGTEVEHRVRSGEVKTKAMEQLSIELGCSYEKVRAAVYQKKH
jgi:hypothetical protein